MYMYIDFQRKINVYSVTKFTKCNLWRKKMQYTQ